MSSATRLLRNVDNSISYIHTTATTCNGYGCCLNPLSPHQLVPIFSRQIKPGNLERCFSMRSPEDLATQKLSDERESSTHILRRGAYLVRDDHKRDLALWLSSNHTSNRFPDGCGTLQVSHFRLSCSGSCLVGMPVCLRSGGFYPFFLSWSGLRVPSQASQLGADFVASGCLTLIASCWSRPADV